jgi:hypothetical protein
MAPGDSGKSKATARFAASRAAFGRCGRKPLVVSLWHGFQGRETAKKPAGKRDLALPARLPGW